MTQYDPDPPQDTGYRALNRRLVLGASRTDTLLVASRHGQNLAAITTGFTYCHYDPSVRPALWCLRFWIHRIFRVASIPKDLRTLVSIARVLNVSAIVATDAYRTLMDAEAYLAGKNLYWVQHGLFIDQRESAIKREIEVPDQAVPITLFAVSDYDVDNYRRWGARPHRILPVGTLQNSFYLTQIANRQPTDKSMFDICIIEKGVKLEPDTELGLWRRDGWRALLEDLGAYCRQNRPQVVLALSKSDSMVAVLNWVRLHLNYEFAIADFDDPFATYKAVDASQLSIGQSSTVLCEALSRNKKILAVNNSDLSFWDLPGGGITALRNPSRVELHDRITELLAMRWETYWSAVPAGLKALTVGSPAEAINIMNRTIAADLTKHRSS